MDVETYLGVLDDAVAAVKRLDVPWAVIGGIASAVLGRPRWTKGDDIDLFVRPQDARAVLAELEKDGFEEEEVDLHWLLKGAKKGIVIDIIFRSEGDLYLDEEMISRLRTGEFQGRQLNLASPEDLIVMKVIAHSEETPRYWHDALGIVANSGLDWDYLMRRARQAGARRVLSLLLYAQSNDLVVPDKVIDELFQVVRAA
jgi:predicted nucleotidyltransferase